MGTSLPPIKGKGTSNGGCLAQLRIARKAERAFRRDRREDPHLKPSFSLRTGARAPLPLRAAGAALFGAAAERPEAARAARLSRRCSSAAAAVAAAAARSSSSASSKYCT